jgi:hypothetical protein
MKTTNRNLINTDILFGIQFIFQLFIIIIIR